MELRERQASAVSPRVPRRKSIGGAVELREPLGAMTRCLGDVARASEVLWSSESSFTVSRATGMRCRKSIGGAVELRAVVAAPPASGHILVARASEVLWSSEQAAVGGVVVDESSQEHRRCCGAPRATRGSNPPRDRPRRKSIGGAVELRGYPAPTRCETAAGSQEHRRCCGAPRITRPIGSGNRSSVARASEVLWSSELTPIRLPGPDGRHVARASEVLWSSE